MYTNIQTDLCYLHGGIEKHHDGSMTIYGTYNDKITGATRYKKRFYDYTIKQARDIARADLKNLHYDNKEIIQ
jgi:hypothetical protein